jgi:verruculogen synthase
MTISHKLQIQRLNADTDPEVVHKVLEEDGAAILQGAIPIDVIERFNRELDPLASATPAGRETIFGVKLPPHAKYVGNLPATCDTFRHEILNNPFLHTLCEGNLSVPVITGSMPPF